VIHRLPIVPEAFTDPGLPFLYILRTSTSGPVRVLPQNATVLFLQIVPSAVQSLRQTLYKRWRPPLQTAQLQQLTPITVDVFGNADKSEPETVKAKRLSPEAIQLVVSGILRSCESLWLGRL
jgi:hypothetical protein